MMKRRIFAIIAIAVLVALAVGSIFHTHSGPTDDAGCFQCAFEKGLLFVSGAFFSVLHLFDSDKISERQGALRPMSRAPAFFPLLC